jgi:hypothetical protein
MSKCLDKKVTLAFFTPQADLDSGTMTGKFYENLNSLISYSTRVPLNSKNGNVVNHTNFSHVEIIVKDYSYCVKSGAKYAFKIKRRYTKTDHYSFLNINVTKQELDKIYTHCELIVNSQTGFSGNSIWYNFILPWVCLSCWPDSQNVAVYDLDTGRKYITEEFTSLENAKNTKDDGKHVHKRPETNAMSSIDVNIADISTIEGKQKSSLNLKKVYEEGNSTFCSKMVFEALEAGDVFNVKGETPPKTHIPDLISPNRLYKILVDYKNANPGRVSLGTFQRR